MIDPSLPLIDLHRHLDGSVRLATILELGLEHNLPLPAKTLEGLRPHVQVTSPQPGLLAFFTKFEWLTKILVDYEACRRIAYENVEDACREGIDYIELRFSPWFMAEANHLDPAGVTEAVIAGVRAGEQDFDTRANLIGILSRTYGPETCWKELDVLLAYRDQLAALDLAGDEIHFPAELFVEHFKKGRAAGWHITVHAGEAAGPENIWQALRLLGAERIGHATRALEDLSVVDFMAEQGIGVETNLTSNVQISAVPNYASHPIKTFLERGLLATINTDDPGISAINLAHEYEIAAPAAGLSQTQIRQAQQNALTIAFLSPAEKEILLLRK
jgi:adenosine deaminase